MNNINPKIQTVSVLLAGMDQRKEAIFQMAFKMHASVRYVLVQSNQTPDLIVVDVDNSQGLSLWHDCQRQYAPTPMVLSSIILPEFEVAYLPKPVKVETLFPVLRAALSGEVTFKPDQALNAAHAVQEKKLSFKQQAQSLHKSTPTVAAEDLRSALPEAEIKHFNPAGGVLGALKAACKQEHDCVILHHDRPLVMIFPSIKKVLLAVPPDVLQTMCQDDQLVVSTKTIADNPMWKEHAKVSLLACLWQVAIWSANGRLIQTLQPDTPIRLKQWPNLTRLAHIPDAMRLSAFLVKAPVSLNMLYKMMRVDLQDILNFLAASHSVDLLVVEPVATTQAVVEQTSRQEQADGTHMPAAETPIPARTHAPGMLQRLLRRLSGK